MAKDKKSIVLYCDLIHTVSQLSDEEAGRLFKHILAYVNDLNPETDKLTQIVFEPIKQQLKRDLREWEKTREERSESGKMGGIKSGEARRSKMKQVEANEANASKTKQNEANEAVTVNVTVTDNERENTSLPIFSIEHCVLVAMKDDRWVKANKATEKDLKEFNSLLEKRGVYNKNPADYKTHYSNWKEGGKKDIKINGTQQNSGGPPLEKIIL